MLVISTVHIVISIQRKKAVTHPVDMDVLHILSIYRNYINKHEIGKFTIGYVGNGEPLLSYDLLKKCIEYTIDLEEKGVLNAYTVTNGTLLTEEKSAFFEKTSHESRDLSRWT